MITVAEAMTRDPLTIGPQASLLDAQALMASKGIRHLPVMENNRLVGILSETDLLAATASQLEVRDDTELAMQEAATPVSACMTARVAVVHPRDSLRRAGLFLQKNRYGCLPVLEEDQLVGIITEYDFVNMALQLMELLDEREDAEL